MPDSGEPLSRGATIESTVRPHALFLSLGALPVSHRAQWSLQDAGFTMAGEVARRAPAELRRLPRLGSRSLSDLESALAGMDLALGMRLVLRDADRVEASSQAVEALFQPLDFRPLSTRASRTLGWARVRVLGQLACRPLEDVEELLGPDSSALGALQAQLQNVGLGFGMRISELRPSNAARVRRPPMLVLGLPPAVQAALVRRLSELRLNARLQYGLRQAGCRYLGDVVLMTEGEVLQVQNVGRKSLKDLVTALAPLGLSLEMPLQDWDWRVARELEHRLAGRLHRMRGRETAARVEAHGETPRDVEGEQQAVASALGVGRQAAIHVYLHGWDGGGKRSTRQAAARFGVSTGRIHRQETRLLQEIRKRDPPLPIASRALRHLRDRCPAPAADLEAELVELGLCRDSFAVESLLPVAHNLGWPPPFDVVTLHGTRVVVGPGSRAATRDCASFVRRAVARRGCATLASVTPAAAEILGSDVVPSSLEAIIGALPGFSWLERHSGWFWLRGERNTLVRLLRKVLSVAPRISRQELQEAVSRNRGRHPVTPPGAIMAELCRQAFGCRIDGGLVTTDEPPDPHLALTGSEQHIWQVLVENGPVMLRSEIVAACLGRGMSWGTVSLALSRSPIVSRLAPRLYALVGAVRADWSERE